MKKTLSLILISIFAINTFSQSISKRFPYEFKKDFSSARTHTVNKDQILTTFILEDKIRLTLYDNNFNLISTKDLQRKTTEEYATTFYLFKKYLIIQEIKNNSFIKTKITLTDKIESEELNINGLLSNLQMDETGTVYHYTSSTTGWEKYINQYNSKTNETVRFSIDLRPKESVRVIKYERLKNSKNTLVYRMRKLKMKREFDVVLHDNKGKELTKVNRLDKGILKSSIFWANNNDDVYVLGNYKEAPTKSDKYMYGDHAEKGKFTGIYLKSLNVEDSIEQYYKYTDFKNFNQQMIADKRIKKLSSYNFNLQHVVFNGNKKIVFSTIEKNTYTYNSATGNNVYDGPEINYILIFEIDEKGKLVWDQVIPLYWKNHAIKDRFLLFEMSTPFKILNVEKTQNNIKCHYLFKEKITSFEVENGELVNLKETPLVKKKNDSRDIKDQYKRSFYWYDNFYFLDYDIDKDFRKAYTLDKIEFNK